MHGLLLLGFTTPPPSLFVAAALGGAVVLLAARAETNRLGTWALIGGWFLFALTSPTAQFPTMFRPLGVFAAFAGVVLLRLGSTALNAAEDRLVPLTSRLLMVYFVFVLIGCIASPFGPRNLVRWIQGVMIVATAFYAVSLGFGRALLASTFLASLTNVVLTVKSGAGEVLPNGYYTNRLAGYMQPNHVAFTAAVVIIGAIWLARDRPEWRIPLGGCVLISTYALLASHSRTALVALVVALAAALIATFIGPGRRGQFAAWSLVAALVLAPVVLPTFGTWFNRDQSESSITSLTGRTDFWPLAVNLIEQRPVVGWGVNVISSSPAGDAFQKFLPGISQAHNSYLEAALMGGIPAAVAWGGALLGIMVGSFRLKRDDPYRFLLISSSILLEFFAFTESSPAWFGDMFIIFALAAAFYSRQRVRSAESVRRASQTREPRSPAINAASV